MSYHGSYLWNLRQKVGHDLVLAPGASVLVMDDEERVLLTRRLDNNIWCMPGGAAEVGSSFATTAITELREETGLVAREEDLIAFACISRPDIHILTYPSGDSTHAFAMWFLLRHWTGTLTRSLDEVTEVKFFNLTTLPSEMLKPTAHALLLYAEYKRTGKFQIS